MTLVGTSPNIIVVAGARSRCSASRSRCSITPRSGFGLAVVGLIFLRFGYRLLPRDRRAAPTIEAALDITDYIDRGAVPRGLAAVGKTVADLERSAKATSRSPRSCAAGAPLTPAGTALRAGDIADPAGASPTRSSALIAPRLGSSWQSRTAPSETPAEEIGVIEAVVTPDSPLVGRTASRIGAARALRRQPAGGRRSRRADDPAARRRALAPATSSCCRAPLAACPSSCASSAACRSPSGAAAWRRRGAGFCRC